jgi:chloramphenicol-sensitive protein RarD
MTLGISSYLIWGMLPLYLALTKPAGALEVLAHRALWAGLMCLVALAFTRGYRAMRAAFADRRTLGVLSVAGVLLTINWFVFVWAATNGHLVDAALGYFINPLVSVLLGVVLLGERLRPAAWVAVGVASCGIVVMGVAIGTFPWVALALAFSFGLYGFIEKKVGDGIPALVSLTVETLVVAPVLGAYVVWLTVSGRAAFPGGGLGHSLIMVGLGAATVVPLLLFNGAARRLPLSTLGFVQYLCPVMQFITGVVIFHEAMSGARWFAFGAVWIALIILTVSAVWRLRPSARQAQAATTGLQPKT